MWRRVLALLGLCLVSDLHADTTACGKQQMRNRIYGGANAVRGEWPWHATLSFKGLPFCGATVIGERWLLTAAHCFDGNETLRDPSSWKASLGFTRLGGAPNGQTVERGLARIQVHEKFTNFINGFDVALVELAEPLNFTQSVQPVCLPQSGHRFRLKGTCWVTGLEDVEEGGDLTVDRPLQKVNFTLIGRKTCNCIYNSYGRFELSNPAQANVICGSNKDGDRGPCSGDSGGPVVCNEDGVWFLAGVVSFSLGCHLTNSPTLFSEVSAYADWIQTKTEAKGPVFFANQTISVSAIPADEDNCTDFISTKNPGCGIPKLNTSGPGARPGEWPWSVDLLFRGSYICEGSLISESYVIAAAHCFVGSGVSDEPKDWTVSMGRPAQLVNLKDISIHGAYVAAAEGSDIAMLKLAQPAVFGDYLQPVCLPRAEHRFRFGSTCWVTGRHGAGSETSSELQEVEVGLIGPNKCNCIYSQPNSTGPSVSILPGMICAAPEQGDNRVCLNDMSGPLVCSEEGAWFLAGVGSFGGSCGQSTSPGIYTEITAFEKWIEDLTSEGYFAPQAEPVPGDLDSESCFNASSGVCGRQVNAESVLSDGDAPEGAWPWLVSIVQYGDHQCSGVLIAESWVLCESHCFSSFPVFERDYDVYLGRPNEQDTSQREMSRKVKRVVQHPQNRFGTDRNYLALVELSPEVIYNDYIQPVCLPTTTVQFSAGSSCWVTGLGEIKPPEGFPTSTARKELKVSILKVEQCNCLFEEEDGPSNQEMNRSLCAGHETGQACLDDSSVPLVCQTSSGSWLLAGLSGADTRCTDPYCPGVYTSAAVFESWIRDVVAADAQFVNMTGELPNVSSNGGPESLSTTGGPQSLSTSVVPQSLSTTWGPLSMSTTEGPLTMTTTKRLQSSSTKGPQSLSTTEGPRTTNTAESPQSTVGSSNSQGPASGNNGVIVIARPPMDQPSAGCQAAGCVLLYCIVGALYLASVSW